MDFTNRGGQARTNNLASNTSSSATPATAAASSNLSTSSLSGSGGSRNNDTQGGHSKWFRLGFLLLLFSGTILAIATLLFLAFGKGSYKEKQFISRNQLQAVFINVNGTNGGQVYFGNIQDMTSQYIRLTNVFYIQNQQANAQPNAQPSSSYNLVKLGCELHGPEDAMMINRTEVFFWENLKADSQVAQKVAEFHKQNPNGQKCTTANSQSGQQSGNTQSATPQTPTPPSPTATPPTPSNTTAPATNNRPATPTPPVTTPTTPATGR